MGTLTQIIAAAEEELAEVGESLRPMDRWSGAEFRGVDIAKLTTLHCMLTGDEYDQALYLYEPVYVSEEGAMVLRVADSLALKLIALKPDGQADVATELAGTLEFEVEKWELDHVRTLIKLYSARVPFVINLAGNGSIGTFLSNHALHFRLALDKAIVNDLQCIRCHSCLLLCHFHLGFPLVLVAQCVVLVGRETSHAF